MSTRETENPLDCIHICKGWEIEMSIFRTATLNSYKNFPNRYILSVHNMQAYHTSTWLLGVTTTDNVTEYIIVIDNACDITQSMLS